MAELMSRQSSPVKVLQKGEIIEGTIKKLTAQEILMDIGAKGDALVIEFDKRNLDNLLRLLKVGQKVKASVISAESEEGFPVVSLRRTLDDMIFVKFEDAYKTGAAISGHISETTRGGYFVDIGEGVSAFLPNSQVTTEEDLNGKTIDLKIIELDRSKKRLIVSQKALFYITDPAEIEKYLKRGDTVKGTISSTSSYGVYVDLEVKKDVHIEGFIHISEVSHDRVENLEERIKKGDTVEAQVLEIDREARRLNLSLKALAKDTFDDIKTTYALESKVKGVVKDVKTRGITLTLSDTVNAFIPENKVPTGTTYEVGQSVDLEVTDYDMKRRLVIVTPVLKKTFVGYR